MARKIKVYTMDEAVSPVDQPRMVPHSFDLTIPDGHRIINVEYPEADKPLCSCIHICYKELVKLSPKVGLTESEALTCQREKHG